MGTGVSVLDDEFDDMVTHFQDAQYVCMQYTGLKDKNGKEIYEGDILTHKTATISYPTPTIVKSVWEFAHMEGVLNEMYGNRFKPDDFEVIGNIYENPELLSPLKEITR